MGSSPTLGAITMLPPLTPTQIARSDGKRSASPDCRIQCARYRASPPAASRASVSLTQGTHWSSSMLGSAVSSSTPNDFQPSSHMGVAARPVMNRQAPPGPAIGCPYDAVGMQSALDSAIGLPSMSTSVSWMLAFLMPAEVRRSFMESSLLLSSAAAYEYQAGGSTPGAGGSAVWPPAYSLRSVVAHQTDTPSKRSASKRAVTSCIVASATVAWPSVSITSRPSPSSGK